MKYALILVLSVLITNDPIKINKINTAKTEAKKAYNAGDYQTAIQKYRFLVDSMGVKEDEVMLNLANAYYLEKDSANAFSLYQSVSASTNKQINSKAHQQLGVMANQQGRAEEALNYFKQAIKADPTNEDARYNYEMLKKKLDEQKKKDEQKQNQQQNKDQKKEDQQNKEQEKKDEQNKDQQNKDEQKKDQQNKDEQKKDQQQKEQQEKEQKEKEEQEKKEKEQQDPQQDKDKKNQEKKDMQNLDREKLEQMKISEEKARMILEAMKNQEKQYLQQNKRKATKSKERSKPDW